VAAPPTSHDHPLEGDEEDEGALFRVEDATEATMAAAMAATTVPRPTLPR
jgi:hypothetical protein